MGVAMRGRVGINPGNGCVCAAEGAAVSYYELQCVFVRVCGRGAVRGGAGYGKTR